MPEVPSDELPSVKKFVLTEKARAAVDLNRQGATPDEILRETGYKVTRIVRKSGKEGSDADKAHT